MKEQLDHNTVGALGEELAARYLASKGFTVFERNYREKWGEIDLIARKSGRVHFVEVKTVSISGKTYSDRGYRAEENVHPQKLKRLSRAIETFCIKRKIEDDFQLDVVAVYLNLKDKTAKISMLDNVF
jgi:putative endonuclease